MGASQRTVSKAYLAEVDRFLSALESAGKATHTRAAYRFDLLSFGRYLAEKGRSEGELSALPMSVLKSYPRWLTQEGLKANSRRRRILTLRKFFRALTDAGVLDHRKWELSILEAPERVERIPKTEEPAKLARAILDMSQEDAWHRRSRALLWTLFESGATVSEVAKLRFDQITDRGIRLGKASRGRMIPLGDELLGTLRALRKDVPEKLSWVFPAWNRQGLLGGSITPRGVELLCRSLQKQLGVSRLTPRLIRHTAVRAWYEEKMPRAEMRLRLGVRSDAPFLIYDQAFKSKS